jgi:hypothetical protein
MALLFPLSPPQVPNRPPQHRSRLGPGHLPAGGCKPPIDILGESEGRRSRQDDPVIVVQNDELSQPEMTGQGGSLGGEPLHEVAVACEDIGEMIHHPVIRAVEAGSQMGLSDRHPHRCAESLTKGSRRHLRPRGMTALRMAGRLAPPLPEGLQIFEGKVIAGQIEERIEEHRAVPGGQDETVAVGPQRIGRIMLQVPRPEGVGRGRGPHRHAGMILPFRSHPPPGNGSR